MKPMKMLLTICLLLVVPPLCPLDAAQPGQKLWEFQTSGSVRCSPAIGANGTVYVASDDAEVYALNGATGQKLWEFQAGLSVQSSPAIAADGTVYVGSAGEHKVYAVNGATGQKRWEFTTGAWVFSSPAVGADGTVYVGSLDYNVYALNGGTGQKRWVFQTGGGVSSSPAIGLDGTVYVGSDDHKVYALNGATGQKHWEFLTGNWVRSSPAVAADGTVYVGSLDKKVYALNGATGQKVWEFQTGGEVYSSPAIGADGTVYVASSKLHAVNGATGQELWEFPGGGYSSPAIGADGTVYAASGNLYAVNGATGQELWEFPTRTYGYASCPAIGSDGTVYVGSEDGKVYALCSSSVGGLAQSPWPKFHADAANQGRVRVATGPPRIVSQSADAMALEGKLLVLWVAADGAWPLSYEWSFNGQLLPGVTGPRYELSAFAASEVGVYRVRVRNAQGVAESAEMVVPLAYAVTVEVVGPGRVSGTNESGVYAAGSVLELTAVADEGCWFAGWSGGASSQANPLWLTVDRTWRLTATFGGAKPGMRLWEFSTGGPVYSSPAIGADGTVYVGSGDSNVDVLNGATGQKLWEFPTGGEVSSSPAIGADGTVYVGSGDKKVYALNGATGRKLWEFQTGGQVTSSTAIGADGTVYVQSWDRKLYALNGATGQKLWAFQTGSYGYSSPAIGADGTVYVGSDDKKVYALNGATGQKLWESQTSYSVGSSPAVGADGTVYVGSGWTGCGDGGCFSWGSVYALTPATGQKLWEFQTLGEVNSSPAIGADGTLYLASGGDFGLHMVYALNRATGQKLWESLIGGRGPVLSSPAVGADGTVYVGSDDKKVYALNGATGQKLWEFQTGSYVNSSPAIAADGTVYVGSGDGKVYALCSSSVGGLAQSSWPKFHGNAQNTGRMEPTPLSLQITKEPAGVRVPVGSDFLLSVSASGGAPLTFQWYHAGQSVPGAVSSVLNVTNAALGHSGDYQVTVNNPVGGATSQVARVVVGYQLTLTTNGVGSIRAAPALEVYEPGRSVVLTAIPGADRTFLGWEGDASGTSNPLTLTVDDSKHVQAKFSLHSGDLKWTFAIGGRVYSSPAIGPDGMVYIGGNDGKVYALNEATGQKLWEFQTGYGVASSPAIGADGAVYVGSYDRKVYALNGVNGAKKWEFVTGDYVESSPAVGADGTIYVGSWDGTLYALDGARGTQKWAFLTPSGVWSSPAIGLDGTVYVQSGKVRDQQSDDQRIHAIDPITGLRKWERVFPTAGQGGFSSPAIGADGTVYVGMMDRRVWALDGATGVTKWEFLTELTIHSSPAIGANGTVYVGCMDRKVYALDGVTGSKKWEFITGDYVWSSPAIGADGTVYVGSWDRRLYALDAASGAKKWEFVTGDYVWSSPAIGADGTVYVASFDGRLYALASGSPGGLADSPWPKFRQNARNAGRWPAEPPRIATQPKLAVLKEGREGRITMRVLGNPAPQVQWFFNTTPLADGTNATLILPAVSRAFEGTYWLVASNTLGQATSAPIAAVVSNLDPLRFPGLRWAGAAGSVTVQTAPSVGGPWVDFGRLPASATSGVYVETDRVDAVRFYRLAEFNGDELVRFTATTMVPGWWYEGANGSRHRIE